MAKAKQKSAFSVPHRHVHSRLSYLYQAATYLATTTSSTALSADNADSGLKNHTTGIADATPSTHQSKYLLNSFRGVSRKALIRLRPDMKHTICKRCDNLLIPGQTARSYVENESKGARKPWADVLILQCAECQTTKSFPTGLVRIAKEKKHDHIDVERVGGPANDNSLTISTG